MTTFLTRIDGAPRLIMGEDDFIDLIREKLGDDAVAAYNHFAELRAEEVREDATHHHEKYCVGECDRLFRQQEYYESELSDIEDEARAIYNDHASMKRPHNLDAIRNLVKHIHFAQCG